MELKSSSSIPVGLVLLLSCWVPAIQGGLPEIMDTCCNIGREWFTRSRMRCTPYTARITSVAPDDAQKCKAIIEICCLDERRNDQCKIGRDLAKLRRTCAGLHSRLGNEHKRECCQCCSLGLIAQAAGLPCNLMTRFEPGCSQSFSQCCEGTVLETTLRPTAPGPGGVLLNGGGVQGRGNRSTGSIPTLIPVISGDDMDECAKFPGQLCDHLCLNTPGSYRCACHDGFYLKSDERTCEQAVKDRTDRCSENNPCDHQCVDTGSAVTCRCFDGFMLEVDGRSCGDVNECVVGTHSCQRNQVCVNIVGSFKCETRGPEPKEARCRTGFGYNQLTRECQDIDECSVHLHKCRSDQECVNNVGSFTCRTKLLTTNCPAGYEYNRISRDCEDMNECALNQDACLVGQYCENTVGSYTCRRSISCGTGYTLDRKTQQCMDDDECKLRTHNCGRAYECRNTPGSFRCVAKRCPDSFKLDQNTGQCKKVVCQRGMRADRSGNCIDINECQESPTACRANQECRNTVGSYTCRNLLTCGPGFEISSAATQCVDIDECTRGTHNCAGRATCVNRRGTFQCNCPEGYQLSNNRRSCEDQDECTAFGGTVCATNSECVNTEGSFRCQCKAGFKTLDGGKTCIDLDECNTPGICQHKCRNTWGSYVCSCYTGYKVAPDGRTCEDIDECSLWSDRGGRLCVGVCTNTPGSYTCGCPSGYRMLGDGRTCQDLDECALGTANCNGPNDFCINTRGEYKCETVECPKGFVRAPSLGSRNNNIRCQRRTFVCPQGDQECLYAPLSYSVNFITFPSNIRVPADLFTMRGPLSRFRRLEFDLKLNEAKDPRTGVSRVSPDFFRVKEVGPNEAVVQLLRDIEGPQDIELQLNMNIYSKEFQETRPSKEEIFFGTAVAKIKVYVTK